MEQKTTDLLQFQKNLNDQFLGLLQEDGTQEGLSEKERRSLGLLVSYSDLHFFVPLADLHSIAGKLSFANGIRTPSWLFGYNQQFGNIYTIINLEKFLDLIVSGKKDYNPSIIGNNASVAYVKGGKTENVGLFLQEFQMENLGDMQNLFLRNQEFVWAKSGAGDEVFKKAKTGESSARGVELYSVVEAVTQSGKPLSSEGLAARAVHDGDSDLEALASLLNGVYLHPTIGLVFALDVQNVMTTILELDPY